MHVYQLSFKTCDTNLLLSALVIVLLDRYDYLTIGHVGEAVEC